MSKNSLSRQHYVEAALEVIGEVGVEKLSMRRVASALGVSPMAMYKHFRNKEELLVETLDAFIAQADVYPDEDLPWDQWVEQLARGMYDALSREMSWVPLLGSLRLGTQAAKVTDTFVRKLISAGFSLEQSLQAYYAMIQTVIGAVCLRSSLRVESSEHDDLSSVTREYLQELDSQRLAIAPTLDAIVKTDQLDLSLPLLLDALRCQKRGESVLLGKDNGS